MTQVSIEEARVRLVELIEKVGQGEDVMILEGERPVARLSSVPSTRRNARRGSAGHLTHYMEDDFEAPLDDFKEYME